MAIGGITSITDRRYRLKITKKNQLTTKDEEIERLPEEAPVVIAPATNKAELATESSKI